MKLKSTGSPLEVPLLEVSLPDEESLESFGVLSVVSAYKMRLG